MREKYPVVGSIVYGEKNSVFFMALLCELFFGKMRENHVHIGSKVYEGKTEQIFYHNGFEKIFEKATKNPFTSEVKCMRRETVVFSNSLFLCEKSFGTMREKPIHVGSKINGERKTFKTLNDLSHCMFGEIRCFFSGEQLRALEPLLYLRPKLAPSFPLLWGVTGGSHPPGRAVSLILVII